MRQEVQSIDNNRDIRIKFILGQIHEKKLTSMSKKEKDTQVSITLKQLMKCINYFQIYLKP